MTTWVYVDGFNLYFGCVKGTPYKWLNIAQLCDVLLPGHQIERIKYFTARVHGRPGDPLGPLRQQTFLRALRTIRNIEIYFGHFLTHQVMMPLAQPVPGLPQFVRVIKTDEKGSDVNLATHLLHDGHLGRYEAAVVVSGDSDLLSPMRFVRQESGITNFEQSGFFRVRSAADRPRRTEKLQTRKREPESH